MNITIKYVCIQFCSFAVVTVLWSLCFGTSLVMLFVGLGMSVVIVGLFAWRDNSVGRYVLHGENLFAVLSDDQLRECYEAFTALEEGKSSQNMLLYQILTRYEDAADNGYEMAAEHLTSEVASRWAHFNGDYPMVS